MVMLAKMYAAGELQSIDDLKQKRDMTMPDEQPSVLKKPASAPVADVSAVPRRQNDKDTAEDEGEEKENTAEDEGDGKGKQSASGAPKPEPEEIVYYKIAPTGKEGMSANWDALSVAES